MATILECPIPMLDKPARQANNRGLSKDSRVVALISTSARVAGGSPAETPSPGETDAESPSDSVRVRASGVLLQTNLSQATLTPEFMFAVHPADLGNQATAAAIRESFWQRRRENASEER
jgi:hypothetical protein